MRSRAAPNPTTDSSHNTSVSGKQPEKMRYVGALGSMLSSHTIGKKYPSQSLRTKPTRRSRKRHPTAVICRPVRKPETEGPKSGGLGVFVFSATISIRRAPAAKFPSCAYFTEHRFFRAEEAAQRARVREILAQLRRAGYAAPRDQISRVVDVRQGAG